MNTFSIKEAYAFGWNKFKAHYLFYLVYVLVAMVVGAVLGGIGERHTFAGQIFSLIDLFYQIAFSLATALLILSVVDGKEPKVESIHFDGELYFKYLATSIFYGVMVAIGTILLIVPGIYLALKYQFFNFAMVDRRLGPADALKESARITEGHKWKLLGLILTAVILNILGALAFGLGLFITVPVTFLAQGYVYRKISRFDSPVVVGVPL